MKADSIYIHHFTPVLNALCQRYKQVDFDDILDAVHDAFEASLSFEGQILQPGAWLYRVAERKLLHFLRKRISLIYLLIHLDIKQMKTMSH